MPQETVQAANVSVVPKVFGILHLVFGGLGVVFGIFGMVNLWFSESYAGKQYSSYPEEMRGEMEALMEPMYEVQVWDIVSSVGSMVLAVLLIVSGVMLVKYRRLGRKISNIYSGLSVVHKLFGIAVVALVKAPAMREVGESLDRMGGGTGVDVGGVMGPAVLVVGVISALVMMVYPVLSFFMLGKKQARESLR